MFNKIHTFLDRFNVLFRGQYGFRPKHSTELALAEALDKLRASLDNNYISMGIFLDLSKAFDTIDHDILIRKLNFYGIRGSALNWFRSYISDRTQYTYVNSSCSNLGDIRCGVPQGSILGPLLFIIYMNDICHVSDTADIILFADDTNIFFKDKHIDTLHITATTELNKFCDWFSANKLSLNVNKTNYMIFNNSRSIRWDKDVYMNGSLVNQVTTTKFLGVHIDDRLTWRNHISIISKKISMNCGILSKLKHFLPCNILRTLYQTLIVPHMAYCSNIWSGTSPSNLNHLKVLQKRALRHIGQVEPREHTSYLFRKFNLLKFADIIDLNVAVFSYKAWNNLLPVTFNDFLLRNTRIHCHRTRRTNQAYQHNFRSNIGTLSLRNRATKLWNSLPTSVKDSSSTTVFKRKIIREIIDQY